MGSATREALSSARAGLAALKTDDGLRVGSQLFEASRVIGDSAQLRSFFADPSIESRDKSGVVDAVFPMLAADSRSLLARIVTSAWSTPDDLLAGIEEVAIRAIASSVVASPGAPSIEGELFTFGSAVASDSELELAVGSKLGSAGSKSALVTALLGGKASEQTLAIVDHLVQQPRGRRIGELIRTAADTVADASDQIVATVVSATALSTAQQQRLVATLSATYERNVRLNLVVDESIIGGVRVQIGDDVIDGSVSRRISDLRLQLAS